MPFKTKEDLLRIIRDERPLTTFGFPIEEFHRYVPGIMNSVSKYKGIPSISWGYARIATQPSEIKVVQDFILHDIKQNYPRLSKVTTTFLSPGSGHRGFSLAELDDFRHRQSDAITLHEGHHVLVRFYDFIASLYVARYSHEKTMIWDTSDYYASVYPEYYKSVQEERSRMEEQRRREEEYRREQERKRQEEYRRQREETRTESERVSALNMLASYIGLKYIRSTGYPSLIEKPLSSSSNSRLRFGYSAYLSRPEVSELSFLIKSYQELISQYGTGVHSVLSDAKTKVTNLLSSFGQKFGDDVLLMNSWHEEYRNKFQERIEQVNYSFLQALGGESLYTAQGVNPKALTKFKTLGAVVKKHPGMSEYNQLAETSSPGFSVVSRLKDQYKSFRTTSEFGEKVIDSQSIDSFIADVPKVESYISSFNSRIQPALERSLASFNADFEPVRAEIRVKEENKKVKPALDEVHKKIASLQKTIDDLVKPEFGADFSKASPQTQRDFVSARAATMPKYQKLHTVLSAMGGIKEPQITVYTEDNVVTADMSLPQIQQREAQIKGYFPLIKDFDTHVTSILNTADEALSPYIAANIPGSQKDTEKRQAELQRRMDRTHLDKERSSVMHAMDIARTRGRPDLAAPLKKFLDTSITTTPEGMQIINPEVTYPKAIVESLLQSEVPKSSKESVDFVRGKGSSSGGSFMIAIDTSAPVSQYFLRRVGDFDRQLLPGLRTTFLRTSGG